MSRVGWCVLVVLLGSCVGGCTARAEPPEDPIEFREGFYGEEQLKDQAWRWMAGEGTVRLWNTGQPMQLVLSGRVVEGPFQKRPNVTIQFNGETLEQFTAPKGMFHKVYAISPAGQGTAEWSELQLRTDQTAVPKEFMKGSKDTRTLGFKLHQLRWEPQSATPPDPTAPPPVRRPWWLISTAAVVTVVVIFAVGTAWWARRRRRMQRE